MGAGTGFPANTSGLIRECGGSVAAPECDTILSGFFITTATGDFPPTPMTVNRVITTFGSTTYNCSVQACALVADAGGKSSRHHISFAGAGTSHPDDLGHDGSGSHDGPGRDDGPAPDHGPVEHDRPPADDHPAAAPFPTCCAPSSSPSPTSWAAS